MSETPSQSRWESYRDFIVKIERATEGRYRVEAQGPTGEGNADFVFPFDEKDLEIFLLKVGRPRNTSSRGRVPEPMDESVDFGQKLFNAVFRGVVRDLFISARHAMENKQTGLRLRLRLADVPELADLPWEFLYDGRDFLALSDETPLIRYLDLPDRPRPPTVTLPLRVLVTVSAPHDQPGIDVEQEKGRISEALATLVAQGKVEVAYTDDASLSTLEHTLRRARARGRPFHVWHYIGHGVYDPVNEASVLIFCDEHGLSRPVGGFQLGTLFDNYPEISLALLNACEGARTGREDPFAGVATALVERGVPAVIGMQFEVSDRAAIAFSSEFYAALVDGVSIEVACTNARRAVFFLPNWVEWATPVLHLRSGRGILFDIQGTPTAPAEPASEPQEPIPRAPAGMDRRSTEPAVAPARAPEESSAEPRRVPLWGWLAGGVVLIGLLIGGALLLGGGDGMGEAGVPGALATPPDGTAAAVIEATSTRERPTETPQPQATPSTAATELLIAPTTTQAPGIIAFESNRDGNWELYTMKSDGSEQTRITNDPAEDWDPVWSPDGSQIAFESKRGVGTSWEIYVIAPDGSGIADSLARGYTPAWSPDGSRIVFSEFGTLAIVNADGTGLSELPGAAGDNPAWSPDGARVAFNQTEEDDNGDLALMELETESLVKLTSFAGYEGEAAWSPDGERIAFVSDAEGNYDIYVINADGSGLAQLTSDPADDREPTWSPDGSRIAFQSNRDGNWEIYVMAADGSGQTNISDRATDETSPAWRP